MEKYKNLTQIAILIEFMENNPDLARGYTKRDKPLVDSLWQELAEALNAAGPPSKEVAGWKKVWTEWKSDIKKKLAHNKAEGSATDGGPFVKQHLNNSDEVIVRLCGISKSVEGVTGISIGPSEDVAESDDDIPSASSKRRAETSHTCNTPKRRRPENISQRLYKFLDEDNERKKEAKDKLEELILVQKENGRSLRRLYRAVEKNNNTVAKAVTDLKNELTNISTRMLTALQEKNQQKKKKQLELELIKIEMERQRSAP